MEPIKFDDCNVVYGKDQSEYKPLPAERRGKPEYGEIVTCWELSSQERQIVAKEGKIWLSMLTFNRPLQPVLLSVVKPEIYASEEATTKE